MKQSMTVFIIFTLLVCTALGAVAQSNMVLNGGFETGDLTSWNGSDPNAIFVSGNSHSGSNAAWLGTYLGVATGVLSQDISTVANQQYQIDFFVANDYLQDPVLSSPSALSVSFGSTTIFHQNPVPYEDYTEVSAVATAIGSTTTLAFTEQQVPGYLFLDDVSVIALPSASVPEWSGTLEMGSLLSLSGLLLLRRYGAHGRKVKRNVSQHNP